LRDDLVLQLFWHSIDKDRFESTILRQHSCVKWNWYVPKQSSRAVYRYNSQYSITSPAVIAGYNHLKTRSRELSLSGTSPHGTAQQQQGHRDRRGVPDPRGDEVVVIEDDGRRSGPSIPGYVIVFESGVSFCRTCQSGERSIINPVV
jgi:hypothetical protein